MTARVYDAARHERHERHRLGFERGDDEEIAALARRLERVIAMLDTELAKASASPAP